MSPQRGVAVVELGDSRSRADIVTIGECSEEVVHLLSH